jgi:phosphatidylinositol kinase/protein kinase (PI-3  family)
VIDQVFKKKNIGCWLKPYEILATGKRCGILEVVQDAQSISAIKEKLHGRNTRLIDFFIH